MLNLEELEQFVAYGDCGTLTKAAETLHISQPTITRTMQRIEESFGVALFRRGKNKIELNDTGKRALELSRRLLNDARGVVTQVRQYDRSLHTITVVSCAPAPLWSLLPALSAASPGTTIASDLTDNDVVLEKLRDGGCAIGIMSFPPDLGEDFTAIPFLRENLFVCVPYDQELACRDSLTFREMNGYNFLLYSEIGFWDAMCREKMPSSKFLVQTDDFAMQELIRTSSLPCFATNLAMNRELYEDRKIIPITDPEANITYYLVLKKNCGALLDFAEKMELKKEQGDRRESGEDIFD